MIHDEVKGHIGPDFPRLRDCRSRYQQQAQHADESKNLLFHISSFVSRAVQAKQIDLTSAPGAAPSVLSVSVPTPCNGVDHRMRLYVKQAPCQS
jgi:hypothetical protein